MNKKQEDKFTQANLHPGPRPTSSLIGKKQNSEVALKEDFASNLNFVKEEGHISLSKNKHDLDRGYEPTKYRNSYRLDRPENGYTKYQKYKNKFHQDGFHNSDFKSINMKKKLDFKEDPEQNINLYQEKYKKEPKHKYQLSNQYDDHKYDLNNKKDHSLLRSFQDGLKDNMSHIVTQSEKEMNLDISPTIIDK
mmetsp:Transcript_8062/g.7136  ORF Transcript_8062/g.7136 Transcript_8062/m.7136 type:complete len:193 (+) Transcript_8062:368-946(+)